MVARSVPTPDSRSTIPMIEAFVGELVRAGVRHACISPGARSTPLALAMTPHAALRTWSHVDERSGSFFALGVAKATREPVAIVCTSGTAAANFYPAVIEAAYAHVPLLILTADRPAELRECGAGQAIDQIKLYGSHVKWFAEVGCAEAGWRYFRALASRAVATARATPPGPVHLNFPFREPLVPSPAERATPHCGDMEASAAPYTRLHEGERMPPAAVIEELADLLARTSRGLIACGPYDADAASVTAVTRLAALAGYPILADPTSQLRSGRHDLSQVIDAYDVILRSPTLVETLSPELVLRIGPMPTSKAFANFLGQHPACRQVVLDPFGPWNDPLQMAADILRCDPGATCERLSERLGSQAVKSGRQSDAAWLATWVDAGRRARRAVAQLVSGQLDLFEGRVFAELSELLPDGASLYVANSMPVRDLEVFWPAGQRNVRVLCNRGANGIDGLISSGLGAAAVSDGPMMLVTGDLGFYHDLNGLLAAKRYQIRAVIIVLNNDGGGIFSYLPQAECGEAFDEYFRTPHGLDFRGAVEMYDCAFTRVASWEQFGAAVVGALNAPRTTVIEVACDHARSVELHRSIWAAGSRAAERERG